MFDRVNIHKINMHAQTVDNRPFLPFRYDLGTRLVSYILKLGYYKPTSANSSSGSDSSDVRGTCTGAYNIYKIHNLVLIAV